MAIGQLRTTETEASVTRNRIPIVLPAVLGAVVVSSFLLFWLWGYQVEDAAMLFTYSENIAAGEGIVYNPGGERVDGASDLLLAILLGGLNFAGLPVGLGAALLNALSLGFIIYAVWAAWERLKVTLPWGAVGAAAVLVVTTPVLFLGATGFGTLFFAGLVTLVAHLVIRLDTNPSLVQLVIVGAAVALAGMDRIEGFILGGAIVFAHSVATRSLRTLLIPAVVAVGVALVWFAWRWSYFGWPLPNPLYKKGGLNPDSLRFSLGYTAVMTAPWLMVLAAGVLFSQSRRRALSYTLLVIAPWALLWVLLSNEMNLAGRFQFPVVPVAAVLSATVGVQVASSLRNRMQSGSGERQLRIGLVVWLVLLGVTTVAASAFATRSEIVGLNGLREASFHQEVAEALTDATGGSGNLVTTEAGMVAWKTDLRVTDLWGLNDKRIAHEGLLTPDQIAGLRPDILFSHPGGGLSASALSDSSHESWGRMNAYLFCFAQSSGFVPVAVWGASVNDLWVVHAPANSPSAALLSEQLSGISRKGQLPDMTGDSVPFVEDCDVSATG